MKFNLSSSVCILIIGLLCSTFSSKAQVCDCISAVRDKKRGIKSIGGMTSSTNSFSLSINKEISYQDTSAAPKYFLMLIAASPGGLSDSLVQTKGTFELILKDSSKVSVNNVSYTNNPFGFSPAIGFSAIVSEEDIKLFAKNAIIDLLVPGIVTTSFTKRSQGNQKLIFNCLLERKH